MTGRRRGYVTIGGTPIVLAKGTRDITDSAKDVVRAHTDKPAASLAQHHPSTTRTRAKGTTVVPTFSSMPLRERVENLLRVTSLTTSQIARSLKAPSADVAKVIDELLAKQRLDNVGTDRRPKWTWRSGTAERRR